MTLDSINNAQWQELLSLFRCRSCGNCCRGGGIVEVTNDEALAICRHMGLTMRRFTREYARPNGDEGFILRDRPGPLKECIFLENNRCQVHDVKPQQCRDYPYKWHEREMLAECEGMREAWKDMLRKEAGEE